MRNMALICTFIFFMLAGQGVAAQPSVDISSDEPVLSWAGLEFQPYVSVQKPVIENVLDFRASLFYFGVPKSKTSIANAYFGPSFTVSEWLQITPMVGMINGWFAEKTLFGYEPEPALILSVWVECSFATEHLYISAQIDGYFGHYQDQRDLYVFYRASYQALSWLNAGLQAEQVNENVILGPHLGAGIGPLHAEFQYFLIPETQSHSLRLVIGLGF